jgi:hypothetical protein
MNNVINLFERVAVDLKRERFYHVKRITKRPSDWTEKEYVKAYLKILSK